MFDKLYMRSRLYFAEKLEYLRIESVVDKCQNTDYGNIWLLNCCLCENEAVMWNIDVPRLYIDDVS